VFDRILCEQGYIDRMPEVPKEDQGSRGR
jgi:hypothetical protein